MKFDELMKAGLKVGDRVRMLPGSSGLNPTNPSLVEGEGIVTKIDPSSNSSNGKIIVKVTKGAHGAYWGTQDLEIIVRAIGAPASDAPVAASRWNGKCARCGCGIYTGLFSVEHEGGACGP